MAIRASIATGNFTSAATWGLVDSTSYLGAESGSEVLTTAGSGTRSSAFTPGEITVSHIGVKLSVRTGTTGTMSVRLVLSSDNSEVSGTAVTINTADLPEVLISDLNGGWHFFKLSSPVTLLAATAYKLEAWTSSSSQIYLFRDGATDNISRALITTTTGAPSAGDDLIIAGEYTGEGTSNSFTVTMDNTATTDFGSAPTAANSLLTPGIAICNKGTLTWGTAAATNYYLKLSNSLIVYSGGTLNIGTTGTPIPRDSTANLQFDCAAAGNYGLNIRNLGTFTHQGLSRTSGKNIYYCLLNTDEAANSTSLGVDTDTGWHDNDVIAIASTTRTSTQCESGTLNGDAGASTLTVDGFAGTGGGLQYAHEGTSPVQAEVILLTRNTNIYGASASNCAYIVIDTKANVDCDWAGYYWLGYGSPRYGIEISNNTEDTYTSSFMYCSFYNMTNDNSRIRISGRYLDISYNCFYNISYAGLIAGVTTSGNGTISYNVFIRAGYNNGASIYMNNLSANINNNRIAGAYQGIILGNSNRNEPITVDSNVIHSCALFGLSLTGTLTLPYVLTISNLLLYRCNNYGINIQTTSAGVIFKNTEIFGNITTNIYLNNASDITFDNLISNGDTSFSTTSAIYCYAASLFINFINCDISTVSGIKTYHTYDMQINSVYCLVKMKFINSKLGSSILINNQSLLSQNSYISSQRHNQTAGLHKTWKREGTLTIESTTTQAGTTSLKMTPINASEKLESSGANGGFKVAVANGQTCTPTVYVYEDASYNGNRARLIVKRNDALGISADAVLDTATAASDEAWEALSGTTAAVTDDGVLEFVVDCDGTAGNLFVDTFSATVA